MSPIWLCVPFHWFSDILSHDSDLKGRFTTAAGWIHIVRNAGSNPGQIQVGARLDTVKCFFVLAMYFLLFVLVWFDPSLGGVVMLFVVQGCKYLFC